jgi:hypothetical protein
MKIDFQNIYSQLYNTEVTVLSYNNNQRTTTTWLIYAQIEKSWRNLLV